jgi:hypothetical protein
MKNVASFNTVFFQVEVYIAIQHNKNHCSSTPVVNPCAEITDVPHLVTHLKMFSK